MGIDVVMCDEAHFLKNGEAQITQAVSGLTANRRLLMSGGHLAAVLPWCRRLRGVVGWGPAAVVLHSRCSVMSVPQSCFYASYTALNCATHVVAPNPCCGVVSRVLANTIYVLVQSHAVFVDMQAPPSRTTCQVSRIGAELAVAVH
eukprot:GHUV01024312.1.p1 GENE.GHUV01024312.1~~GHUV01024312.1.p1  ORF type:complete len:146 (-),score=20.92 GHUV01024312.1:250-687(-)